MTAQDISLRGLFVGIKKWLGDDRTAYPTKCRCVTARDISLRGFVVGLSLPLGNGEIRYRDLFLPRDHGGHIVSGFVCDGFSPPKHKQSSFYCFLSCFAV